MAAPRHRVGAFFGVGLAVVLLITGLPIALLTWVATGGCLAAAASPALPPGGEQSVAATVHRVGVHVGASPRAQLAAFEAGLVESGMRNLHYGDRDSLGVFQQRDSWGTTEQRLDVAWATRAFHRGSNGHPGALWRDSRLPADASAGQLAQAVQVSAHPQRYDERETEARALLAAVANPRARTVDNDGGAPGAWGGHRNGRIPAQALASIPGHPFVLLRADAAASAGAMIAAAAQDGVTLTPGGGYRDYDTQVRLRLEKGRWAATPGTSNHGWGLAIDWSGVDFDTRAFAWMHRNAAHYGWTHPTWARQGGSLPEPWHWEFGPSSAQVATLRHPCSR